MLHLNVFLSCLFIALSTFMSIGCTKTSYRLIPDRVHWQIIDPDAPPPGQLLKLTLRGVPVPPSGHYLKLTVRGAPMMMIPRRGSSSAYSGGRDDITLFWPRKTGIRITSVTLESENGLPIVGQDIKHVFGFREPGSTMGLKLPKVPYQIISVRDYNGAVRKKWKAQWKKWFGTEDRPNISRHRFFLPSANRMESYSAWRLTLTYVVGDNPKSKNVSFWLLRNAITYGEL